MNRPLTAQQIRDQAEALAQGAQEKADIAKAKQKEAEAKAEAAKARVLKMVPNASLSADSFSRAMDIRNKCIDDADQARAEAESEAQSAREARQIADHIIAKVGAEEAKH